MAGEVLSHTILEVNAPEARTRVVSAGRPTVPANEWRFALLLTLAFLLVTIPVALHHEMGRDELQEWLIARDAGSMGALLRIARYEGHPLVWYLFLRPISQVLPNPGWLQVISLAISAVTVYVFGVAAPLSRMLRVLFAFGYFMVYGYSVVARGYALQTLLILVVCLLIVRPRPRFGVIGVLLVVIESTYIYGTILAAAVVAGLLAQALFGDPRRERWQTLRRMSPAIVLGSVGLLLAVAQVRPQRDAAYVGNGAATPFAAPLSIVDRLTPIWAAYVPIPQTDELGDVWTYNALTDRSQRDAALGVVLSLVAVAVFSVMIRRSPLALTFYLSATAVTLGFSVFVFIGWLYHFGTFLVALVCAILIAAGSGKMGLLPAERGSSSGNRMTRWVDSHAGAIVGLIFALQVVGGGVHLVFDYVYPFSTAKSAADYIRSHGLADGMIVSYPSIKVRAVSAYLERPLFALDRGVLTTFTLPYPRPAHLNDHQVLAAMSRCCVARAAGAVLVLDHPLRATDSAVNVRELAGFPQAIFDERFFLYEVRRR